MPTTRSFSAMLNEYLPNELLAEEFIKRDWFLQNVQRDEAWLGGDTIVPFEGAQASSVKFGGLTDESDISEYQYVRGKLAGYKEVWGSLIFNETDIMQHGVVNEQNFLKMLPGQVDKFVEYMKMAVSINLLGGPHFAKITDATNAATGVLVVDKIDRFTIGQKLTLSDNGGVAEHYENLYVITINIDDSKIILSATRGGAFGDLSGAGTLFNGVGVSTAFKFYHDGIAVAGVATNGFNTVKSALLSSANGGSATLHGVSKTAWPFLQAVNISGATISSTNILDKLFDAWGTMKIKAKAANPDKCVMSYKHLATIMKLIETDKSPFRVTATQTTANKYNWTEINVTGVRGGFSLVGIQEMEDEVIEFLDMSAMTFRTNGFFQKKKGLDGLEYYRIRSTSGFKDISDVCLFGELEVTEPAKCGIIHSISNY